MQKSRKYYFKIIIVQMPTLTQANRPTGAPYKFRQSTKTGSLSRPPSTNNSGSSKSINGACYKSRHIDSIASSRIDKYKFVTGLTEKARRVQAVFINKQ